MSVFLNTTEIHIPLAKTYKHAGSIQFTPQNLSLLKNLRTLQGLQRIIADVRLDYKVCSVNLTQKYELMVAPREVYLSSEYMYTGFSKNL